MKVLVACLEDKAFEFQAHAGDLHHSAAWPHFWMPCVRGDDWFQRVSLLSRAAPVDVRQLDGVMFVLYQSRQDAEAFATWVPEALAEVERGYRTMRG
jgi:hypothetical protein